LNINFNNQYPTYNDITIYDSTGNVNFIETINFKYFEIENNSNCILKIPIINDKIKEQCNKYINDNYKLLNCNLILTSNKVNQ